MEHSFESDNALNRFKKKRNQIERIYHHHDLWEDFKNGMYDNQSGQTKEVLIKKSVKLLSSEKLTKKFMKMVVDKWIYSCEHNLSNYSLNRIAYLGQSACCLYAKVPSSLTMTAWSLVKKEYRDKADCIAEETIKQWELNRQLCLRFY